MNRRVLRVVPPVVVSVLLLITGCAVPGELQTESRWVEVGGAESARVEITMGAGILEVDGGADDLLEAEFAYSVASWKPEVEYVVSGTRGLLTVRQPSNIIVPLSNVMNEWDLRLNDDVPMDLSIGLGAGEADLELSGLSLASLEIKTGASNVELDLDGSRSLAKLDLSMGAGSVTVDLTGDWQSDLDATVTRGVGDATVLLPSAVGVRVEAPRGLGTINASGLRKDGDVFVNDAYGESDVTLRITVVGGIGDVDLKVVR